MKEILDSQPQEGEVLNGMTSDVEMESVGTAGDWEMVDMIQETQEVQEEIEKEKKKGKKEGIKPVVPRALILTPKVDSKEGEKQKYEQMKLRQKTVVDRLLEEFPWFNRRQITVLIAVAYFEAKLRWKIARNFYTKLEIEEDEDPEFKETHGRRGEPLKDEVKKCMAENYSDVKCIKNGVPMNTQSFKTHNKFYHEGLRVEIQLDRLRKEMEQYPTTRKYGKSNNYYPQVVREDPTKEEEVG
jgi:hypothetical protein